MDTNNQGAIDNKSQEASKNEGVNNQTPKTFDDFLNENPNYQSAHDKKVADALVTAQTKWEKDRAEKESEAQKLSKMKEDERKDYELEQERKARLESEAKLNAYELKEEAIKIANNSETKVDVSLLSLIDFSTIKAEQVEPIIKNIKKVFDSAVEEEVNKRLKEPTPKNVVGNTNSESKKSIPNVF